MAKQYNLQSAPLIHAPGILIFLKDLFTREPNHALFTLREGWEMPDQHARAILDGSVEGQMDGDTMRYLFSDEALHLAELRYLSNGALVAAVLGEEEARKVDFSIPQASFDTMTDAERADIAGWWYEGGSIFGRLLTRSELLGIARERFADVQAQFDAHRASDPHCTCNDCIAHHAQETA